MTTHARRRGPRFESHATTKLAVAIAAAANVLGGCAVQHLPSCGPPPAGGITVAENVQIPPEGTARVFLESDPPAMVLRRQRAARPVLANEEHLCNSTPCTIFLPYGDHALTFASAATSRFRSEVSNVTVHVDAPYVAARVRLNRDAYSTGVFVGLGIAAAGATTSFASVLAAGSGRGETGRAFDVVALVGLVPLVAGLVIAATSTSTHQEGGATQWNPKTTARSDGLSFQF